MVDAVDVRDFVFLSFPLIANLMTLFNYGSMLIDLHNDIVTAGRLVE